MNTSGRYLLAIIALLLAAPRLRAQPADTARLDPPAAVVRDTLRPDAVKLVAIGGVTVGGFIYGHAILSNLWWKGTRSDFHFEWEHDWKYALGADKIGHAYFPCLITNIYRDALLWSRLDSATSLWLASGLGMTYMTYMEVRDGFSKEWGFSWGDFVADALGAAYPVAQHYIPPLKNITFKMSFYPSAKFKAGMYHAIIDDYESQYQWLGIDLHHLTQEGLGVGLPPLINLAIGHSVKDLDLKGGGYHELYLALDWNLEALPGDGAFWRFLKHTLNLYHLPAPAVKIYPNVVWYGIHF